MSKNVSINEGRTARTFSNVAKLKTNAVGGGSDYWVPEGEVGLTTKTISKNGTYKSVDDGAYGYSEVEVDVAAREVSGTDSNGNPYTITSDDIGNVTMSQDDADYSVDVDVDPQTGEPVVSLDVLYKLVFTDEKTQYNPGESLDLSDFSVGVYIGDSAEPEDVTGECTFSMTDGTVLHTGTYLLLAYWTHDGRKYTAKTTLNVKLCGVFVVNGTTVDLSNYSDLEVVSWIGMTTEFSAYTLTPVAEEWFIKNGSTEIHYEPNWLGFRCSLMNGSDKATVAFGFAEAPVNNPVYLFRRSKYKRSDQPQQGSQGGWNTVGTEYTVQHDGETRTVWLWFSQYGGSNLGLEYVFVGSYDQANRLAAIFAAFS